MLKTRLGNAGGVIFFAVICFCLFFHRVWGGDLLLGADPLMYSLPLRTVAWNMLEQGSLPLWTPLILSGYPLLSMAQLGLAYPLTWGYLFFPNYIAEQIYVLAPFLLAPLFTYAWVRELGLSRIAALLAGFSFGYGGMMSGLLSNGMMPNAVIWLPLLLVALKRSKRQNFLSCLLSATAACTMSLFTGIGQGFLLVFLLALAWSFFQALPSFKNPSEKSRQRLAPLATLAGALAAGSGIAAFQLLETAQAARLSIRAGLSYETFTEMSFTPAQVSKSFLAPLFHHENWVEVTAFVPIPVALLSLFAVLSAVRRRKEKARTTEILFWTVVAGAAFVLMLGDYTPLYRLLYRIPILNQFRAPSRHAFEWSFAISILAAYGWDALNAAWRTPQKKSPRITRIRRIEEIAKLPFDPRNPRDPRALLHCFRASQRDMTAPRKIGIGGRGSGVGEELRLTGWRPALPVVGSALLLGAGLVGVAWWLATADNPAPALLLKTGDRETAYLIWKSLFTLLLIGGTLLALTEHPGKWRTGLILGSLFLICLVEPYILMSRWWGKHAIPVSRPNGVSPVTQFLRHYTPAQNRIYTRVHGGIEQSTSSPRLDPPNLTALHGLHNVAGYEPLIMKRYSRALGNAGRDAVHPGYADPPDETLFEPGSQVLNILNTVFVAAFSELRDLPENLIQKGNVQFNEQDFPAEAQTGEVLSLNGKMGEGDTLNIVSTLANAAGIEQGATIAKVRIITADNRLIQGELRAGIDSAEWAHERADVRPIIKHSSAPTFDCHPGDENNSFSACRYWSQISLGQTLSVKNVEVIKLANLSVWKATLFDSLTQRSTPLSPTTKPGRQAWRDEKRWRTVYDRQGALILQNSEALPRAWLVTLAEAVGETAALQRIRGENDQPFNPRLTALLEISSGEEFPALPGGALPPEAGVKSLTYQPNGLAIETFADRPTLLVVSEMNYPGWTAAIDGSPARVYTANYLLQAMTLPAGRHLVEMRYTAPAAARGLVISGITLLALAGVTLRAKVKSKN